MTQIINLTPHTIHLILKNGEISHLPSEGVARVSATTEVADEVKVSAYDLSVGEVVGFEIPVFRQTFGEVQELPEPTHNTIYIVSRMVKSAVPDRTDCLVPHNLVRDDKGNIIGCKAFSL